MTHPPIDTLHILPSHDLIEHETNEQCPCGPTTRPSFRGDGSNGWLVVHHSLDGRELAEGDAS